MELQERTPRPNLTTNQSKSAPPWWPNLQEKIYGGQVMQDISWQKWSNLEEQILRDRSAAISHRENEQVDNLFLMCEEAYIGIDDVNRGEHPFLRPTKGTLIERGDGSSGDTRRNTGRTQSKLFIRLPARYVDAAKAKIGEIGVPVDGKWFDLQPTPMPTNIQGEPIDQAQADAAMKIAEDTIHDWLVEGHFTLELRKVISDAARLGVGVLKGPEPTIYKMQRPTRMQNGRWQMHDQEGLRPASRWVNAWNFYPAPSCGEDIHHGEFCLERDYYSRRQIEDLVMHEAYFKDHIKKVLEMGPGSHSSSQDPTRGMSATTAYQAFEVWFYHSRIPFEQLRTVKPEAAQEWIQSGRGQGMMDMVPVQMTLINDMVVSCALNPLMGGDFPYDTMPWERRPGSWVGIGICEQLFAPTKLLQATNRAMIRNAGNSSGSQIVMDQTGITPLDNDPTIYPDKLWVKTPDSVTDDVEKAFQVYEIPSRIPDLMRMIEFAMRIAEESTNIPLVTQGHSGQTQPETYGGLQLQNNNATQLLREIGANMDNRLLEPHLKRYYRYFIESPDIPDEHKGDWQVHAMGTGHLIERPFQDQLLMQMGQLLQNPSFKINPAKWFEEIMRMHRLDPNRFKFTEEEYQQIMENQPPPPQVQVQAMRGEVEQMKIGAKQQKDSADAQLQMLNLQVQSERDAAHAMSMTNTHERGMMQIQMLYDRELLKYANENQMKLEDVKLELATTAMKLNAQMKIARDNNQAKQVTKPATEPPGRAKPGKAYQH